MSNHANSSTPDPRREGVETLAALYVGGALSPAELDDVERRLDGGDPELAAAIRAMDPAVRGLVEAIPPAEPPAAARGEVVDRVRGADDAEPVWRDWGDDGAGDALFTMRADEGAWEATGVEGVEVRRLFVDRPNNRMTAMFRMAPGTAYVPHVHDQPEECYVLAGDLHVGDELVMHAGDYQRAPAGSLHGVQRTEGGCLLLVTCSLDDEHV